MLSIAHLKTYAALSELWERVWCCKSAMQRYHRRQTIVCLPAVRFRLLRWSWSGHLITIGCLLLWVKNSTKWWTSHQYQNCHHRLLDITLCICTSCEATLLTTFNQIRSSSSANVEQPLMIGLQEHAPNTTKNQTSPTSRCWSTIPGAYIL